MANISKITLPNGTSYDIKDNSKQSILNSTNVTTTGSGNVITNISASNGAVTAVKENTFLTEEETKTYINNHIIVSSTEPVGQSENDIWVLISDLPSNVYDNGDQLSYGVEGETDE